MNILDGAGSTEQALIRMSASKRIPVNGSIEVSPLCNMNCDMCYVRLSGQAMESKGRLRTADEWLRVAEQMKEAGTLFMLLTGGEPLLYPDFRKLYLGLKKLGMIITINTNGTLIDEEWAEFFEKNKPRRVNVTLYGADDAAYQSLCHYPGGFGRTMSGIKLLKGHGVDVKLSFSLTRDNINDLERMHQIAQENDLFYTMDPYMTPATRERDLPFGWQSRVSPEEAARASFRLMKLKSKPEQVREYCRRETEAIDRMTEYYAGHPEEHIPGPMGCLAGKCSYSVSWQGELHPCVMLTDPSVNVFETDFASAWEQISENLKTVMLNKDCSVCPRKNLCMTCAAAALFESGSHEGKPEYLCRFSEERERLCREELESV